MAGRLARINIKTGASTVQFIGVADDGCYAAADDGCYAAPAEREHQPRRFSKRRWMAMEKQMFECWFSFSFLFLFYLPSRSKNICLMTFYWSGILTKFSGVSHKRQGKHFTGNCRKM